MVIIPHALRIRVFHICFLYLHHLKCLTVNAITKSNNLVIFKMKKATESPVIENLTGKKDCQQGKGNKTVVNHFSTGRRQSGKNAGI